MLRLPKISGSSIISQYLDSKPEIYLTNRFHVCAEHATIIRSVTKIQTKNIKCISARQAKQSDGWCEIWYGEWRIDTIL